MEKIACMSPNNRGKKTNKLSGGGVLAKNTHAHAHKMNAKTRKRECTTIRQ